MRCSSLALLCLILAAPLSVKGQRPSDEAAGRASEVQVRAEARALVEAARVFFDAQDYARALEAFADAYALVPIEQLRYNMGICAERLQRYEEALEHLDAAAKARSLGKRQRRAAREARRRVERRLATIAHTREVRPDDVDPQPASQPSTATTMPTTVAMPALRTTPAMPAMPALSATPQKRRHWLQPSWLGWSGAATALAGTAGIVAFGLRTQSLHDDFQGAPSHDTADRGELMRAMTNASIAVAAVGATLLLVDLLLIKRSPRR